MDRYLYREIIELKDYIEWRILIDMLNREYHKKLYYGFNRVFIRECVSCRVCDKSLWNWRLSFQSKLNDIYRIKEEDGCFYYERYQTYDCCKTGKKGIKLSKNY